jgi:hypothetical protein
VTYHDRITTYPDRAAWLADARPGAPDYCIGGSSAHLFRSDPWRLYERAHDPQPPDDGPQDDGEWWEPRLASYVVERGMLSTLPEAPKAYDYWRIAHPEHAWLRPSPDWVAEHPEIGPVVVDFKTAFGGRDWPEGGAVLNSWREAFRSIPAGLAPKYCMQGAVARASVGPEVNGFAWVVALHFRDVRVIAVRGDDASERAWVGALASWRERHLVQGEEPRVDGSQAAGAHLRRLPREGDVEGTEEDAQLAEDYERAKADEKAARDAKRAASNALYARHRGSKRVELPNGGRVSLGASGIRVTGLEE